MIRNNAISFIITKYTYFKPNTIWHFCKQNIKNLIIHYWAFTVSELPNQLKVELLNKQGWHNPKHWSSTIYILRQTNINKKQIIIRKSEQTSEK